MMMVVIIKCVKFSTHPFYERCHLSYFSQNVILAPSAAHPLSLVHQASGAVVLSLLYPRMIWLCCDAGPQKGDWGTMETHYLS